MMNGEVHIRTSSLTLVLTFMVEIEVKKTRIRGPSEALADGPGLAAARRRTVDGRRRPAQARRAGRGRTSPGTPNGPV